MMSTGVRFAGGLIVLLVAVSMIDTISSSRKIKPKCFHSNWNKTRGSNATSYSYSYCGDGSGNGSQPSSRPGSEKIVQWSNIGQFNYYDMWAMKNQPFFDNDTLVFQYNSNYNVHLMNSEEDMRNCQFKGAKLIAKSTAGAGHGFVYVLKAKTVNYLTMYYFADGKYCQAGMRFSVHVIFK